MLKFLIPTVAVAALATSSVPALAQNWGASLEARKAMIDRRIDLGVRNGALNYAEANRLRAQFSQVLRLEATYRRNGLNSWERMDLHRRLDRLSAEIRFERRDRDYGYGQDYRGYDNGYYGDRY